MQTFLLRYIWPNDLHWSCIPLHLYRWRCSIKMWTQDILFEWNTILLGYSPHSPTPTFFLSCLSCVLWAVIISCKTRGLWVNALRCECPLLCADRFIVFYALQSRPDTAAGGRASERHSCMFHSAVWKRRGGSEAPCSVGGFTAIYCCLTLARRYAILKL